jgi:catechol 2,3-dioxygenase-like lactoylglutathione lyase family enzyme
VTRGITHIQITVADVKRSRAFYQGVFGMELLDLGEPDPDFIFLRTPGSRETFTLNGHPQPGRRPGDMGAIQHFGFGVADSAELDRLLARVEPNGGRFVRRGERDDEVYAFITDPDGYSIELYTD